MYSVLLMAAMSGGVESPEFFRKKQAPPPACQCTGGVPAAGSCYGRSAAMTYSGCSGMTYSAPAYSGCSGVTYSAPAYSGCSGITYNPPVYGGCGSVISGTPVHSGCYGSVIQTTPSTTTGGEALKPLPKEEKKETKKEPKKETKKEKKKIEVDDNF